MIDQPSLSSPPPVAEIDADRAQHPERRLLKEASAATRRSALELRIRSSRAQAMIDTLNGLRDRSDR